MLGGRACTSHTACVRRSEGNLKLGSHLPSHLRRGPCCSWLRMPALLAHKLLRILSFLPPTHGRSNRIIDGAASSFFTWVLGGSRSGPHTHMASSLPAELPFALKRATRHHLNHVSVPKDRNNWGCHFQRVFCAKGEQ